MKLSAIAAIAFCVAAAGLAAIIWSGPFEIRHYRVDELAGLTCEALGERHEDVIVAYHDAEIAHYRQAGAFHDDLGIPTEDVLPYAVLIKWFVRDYGISETDIAGPSSETPILSSDFYFAVSGLCATNPSWLATDAMRQAALNLGLIVE